MFYTGEEWNYTLIREIIKSRLSELIHFSLLLNFIFLLAPRQKQKTHPKSQFVPLQEGVQQDEKSITCFFSLETPIISFCPEISDECVWKIFHCHSIMFSQHFRALISWPFSLLAFKHKIRCTCLNDTLFSCYPKKYTACSLIITNMQFH